MNKKHPEFSPPKRIFLQIFDEDGEPNEITHGGITWCEDRENETDIEYVRKDAHE
jgi:hypothetical protein